MNNEPYTSHYSIQPLNLIPTLWSVSTNRNHLEDQKWDMIEGGRMELRDQNLSHFLPWRTVSHSKPGFVS